MESLPAEFLKDFFFNLVAGGLGRLARRYRQESLEKHYLAVYILPHYY